MERKFKEFTKKLSQKFKNKRRKNGKHLKVNNNDDSDYDNSQLNDLTTDDEDHSKPFGLQSGMYVNFKKDPDGNETDDLNEFHNVAL